MTPLSRSDNEPSRARPATPEEIEAMGGGKIRVLGGATYLTGNAPNSIKVEAKNRDGWLSVDITADEGVQGYAVTFNGKSLPNSEVETAARALLTFAKFAGDQTFEPSLAEALRVEEAIRRLAEALR